MQCHTSVSVSGSAEEQRYFKASTFFASDDIQSTGHELRRAFFPRGVTLGTL
jgi:hypothetical protein